MGRVGDKTSPNRLADHLPTQRVCRHGADTSTRAIKILATPRTQGGVSMVEPVRAAIQERLDGTPTGPGSALP